MKNTMRHLNLFLLIFFALNIGQIAWGQALDDHSVIIQAQEALRQNGINVGRASIRIQVSNGKRHLVVKISGRRTLIVDMVYNTFYTIGSITQKAQNSFDIIVVNASAQYKEIETYRFRASASCTEDLYNGTTSPDEFINNCMTIK